MKVLLLKDVYKLGHAGDVKKVADGYGRNYLMPQGLAVLATPGEMKRVEFIRKKAAIQRAVLNQEMSGLAEMLSGAVLTFASKAGETGKLYGSITTQMIADEINKKFGCEIDRRHIESEPIRTLGEHTVHIRLTVDIVPEIKVITHREGEAPPTAESALVAEEVLEEVAEEKLEPAPLAEEELAEEISEE